MKTKYIISGAVINGDDSNNDNFFREILKDTPSILKVLVILFAKPESKIDLKYEITKRQFERIKSDKIISYDLASHERLSSQIKNSQIVYIHGGSPAKLIEEINQHPCFVSMIKGKVVAGESSGAYLLSSKFYSGHIGHIADGLGVLPIKLKCHFKDLHEKKLDSIDNNLEKVLLRDYEYRVYVQ